MDPLTLLKDFNLGKKSEQVKVVGEQVHFGTSYVFPKASFTAFKGGARDYYTLEAVLYVLQTRQLSQAEFLKAANAAKISTFSFVDRKRLLDFLDGKAELQLDGDRVLPSLAPAADADALLEPAQKRARIQEDGEAAGAESLNQQERQLRDRNTMLLAPSKEFRKVMEIAAKASAQLAALAKQQAAQPAQPVSAPSSQKDKHSSQPGKIPGAMSSGRFERDNTKDQLKAMGGEKAAAISSVIDMYGHAGQASQPQVPTVPAPPPPPPPSSSQHRPPSSSQQAAKPHHHSSSGSQKHHHSGGGGSAKPAAPPSAKPGPEAAAKGGMPIIIVPSGLTAMINMYNARSFLEEGKFETTAQAQARGEPKQAALVFNRTAIKPPGKSVPYMVTDKPPAKGSPDWHRVVAVIVQGAKWQFKDWTFFKGAAEGELLETFNHVAGFFMHFQDEKVPDTVSNWNVKRLAFRREARHMDMTVLLDFYRHLDQFLQSRRSQLAY